MRLLALVNRNRLRYVIKIFPSEQLLGRLVVAEGIRLSMQGAASRRARRQSHPRGICSRRSIAARRRYYPTPCASRRCVVRQPTARSTALVREHEQLQPWRGDAGDTQLGAGIGWYSYRLEAVDPALRCLDVVVGNTGSAWPNSGQHPVNLAWSPTDWILRAERDFEVYAQCCPCLAFGERLKSKCMSSRRCAGWRLPAGDRFSRGSGTTAGEFAPLLIPLSGSGGAAQRPRACIISSLCLPTDCWQPYHQPAALFQARGYCTLVLLEDVDQRQPDRASQQAWRRSATRIKYKPYHTIDKACSPTFALPRSGLLARSYRGCSRRSPRYTCGVVVKWTIARPAGPVEYRRRGPRADDRGTAQLASGALCRLRHRPQRLCAPNCLRA